MEDFARPNANRLLARYRDRLCTFNDDIQGTAAVAAGALLAAVNVTGLPLVSQRIAVFGAGSAGCGIASLLRKILVEAGLTAREAQDRFFLVDRSGLLLDGTPEIESFQCEFVRSRDSVAGWTLQNPDTISLYDVVRNAKPTVLIGVFGAVRRFPGARCPCDGGADRAPRDLPTFQSNVTLRGNAFGPAPLDRRSRDCRNGKPVRRLSTQRSRIQDRPDKQHLYFPGVGLAGNCRQGQARKRRHVHCGRPVRLPPHRRKSRLGTPICCRRSAICRDLSVAMALSVAIQARREGLTDVATDDIEAAIRAKMWQPEYRPYVRAS